ncbi:MAG: uracil-DNA glycosylase family protein [Cohaesibacteraceae bacterium]
MNPPDLSGFLGEIADCRVCRDTPRYGTPLPHEPRPVLQLSATARLLLSGQAPGTRVHASGRPFTDPSGDRLRQWLGIDEARFYNPDLLAIVPMGFCFPGLDAKGGDLPPRRECRETWHDRLFASRAPFDLTVLIGRYARDHHLPELKRESLTATVERFGLNPQRVASDPVIVLPHPSWRNTAWLKRHPWFDAEMVPALQRRVASLLNPA